MKERVFRALLKKELLEVIRSYKFYIFLTVLYSMFLEWFIVRNYVLIVKKNEGMYSIAASNLLRQSVGISLIYVAPMMITFIGNLFMIRNFIHDRFSGALIPLLSTGISTKFLWKVKLAASFLSGYAVFLVCIIANLAMMKFYFKIPILWSFYLIVTIFFISPIVSLSILAIFSVIYWTFKAAQIIASSLPNILVMSIWALVSKMPHVISLLKISTAALLISVILIGICSMIIGKLRRGLIAGVGK